MTAALLLNKTLQKTKSKMEDLVQNTQCKTVLKKEKGVFHISFPKMMISGFFIFLG